MSYSGTKWAERLNYLATIEDGWYEGWGEAVPPEALDKANEILHLLDSPNFHVPGIFPLVEEGIIGMEWSERDHDCLVSLQFTKDFTYEVYSMNTKQHMDDDVLVETDSFEDAMKLLRECLTKAGLLTRCVTRD
jgi:hypothetical protein